jgi:hypothetical protein
MGSSEIDLFVAGITGGAIAGFGVAVACLGHMKWCFDQRLKVLQMQIVALQVAVGGGNEVV